MEEDTTINLSTHKKLVFTVESNDFKANKSSEPVTFDHEKG